MFMQVEGFINPPAVLTTYNGLAESLAQAIKTYIPLREENTDSFKEWLAFYKLKQALDEYELSK